MKCYIVQGNSGEYDDYREWIVGAFLSEAKANRIAAEYTSNPEELDECSSRSYSNEYNVIILEIDEEVE